ncbi:GM22634 [Drosophila sechellia]|uniref:GM22634 n=1 Tax=Drosophila sechellia TaxID=7238 RepID=B4I6F4_DROSE|nr:GM22634 [Drosophila sechellia]
MRKADTPMDCDYRVDWNGKRTPVRGQSSLLLTGFGRFTASQTLHNRHFIDARGVYAMRLLKRLECWDEDRVASGDYVAGRDYDSTAVVFSTETQGNLVRKLTQLRPDSAHDSGLYRGCTLVLGYVLSQYSLDTT